VVRRARHVCAGDEEAEQTIVAGGFKAPQLTLRAQRLALHRARYRPRLTRTAGELSIHFRVRIFAQRPDEFADRNSFGFLVVNAIGCIAAG
jgi:hypothetical protein